MSANDFSVSVGVAESRAYVQGLKGLPSSLMTLTRGIGTSQSTGACGRECNERRLAVASSAFTNGSRALL